MDIGTHDREFDIVLFGATSFVGATTARYLVDCHPELKIAVAGRNADKLAALDLGVETIVADAQDAAAIDALVQRTAVLISTVGPYTRYGDEVVRACAQYGTHYVDLCGEALFIRRTIDQWHATAQETGAKIVPSCGFDSVPSDMGMFHLFSSAGYPEFAEVTMAVDHLQGGLSGGTIDSMRAVSKDAKEMPKGGAILHSPHSLSPDHEQEPDLGPEPDLVVDFDELLQQWAGPFFMAMFNTRVVRRSNSLLGHAYGPMRYREVIPTGTGLAGKFKANLLKAVTAAGFAIIMVDKLRRPLSRFIPEPGEGPKDIDAGGFVISHTGLTTDGALHTSRVAADGDPGYKTTAMMLAEAAVTLATQPDDLPETTGVLTPATGLGRPYLRALQAHGMRFS